MAEEHGQTTLVNEVLDSTLESVDHAEQMAIDVARKSGFDEDDQHRIGMAVRELMVNAVAHGNRYSALKKVEFAISRNSNRYSVRIADQGDGFDVDQLPDPLAEDNLLRHSGRGLFLVRSFMDDLVVRRRQPAGMEVVFVKKLPAEA